MSAAEPANYRARHRAVRHSDGDAEFPAHGRPQRHSQLAAEIHAVSLGLDLQGGSYLLLEVDLAGVYRERLETSEGDIRAKLRDGHIGYSTLDVAGKHRAACRSRMPARPENARKILNDLTGQTAGVIGFGVGTRDYDLVDHGGGGNYGYDDLANPFMTQMNSDIVDQSIEVVRRRIDQLGTREPTLQRQGDDRILVQVPGLSDLTELIKLISTTAKMSFRMVDTTPPRSTRANPTSVQRPATSFSMRTTRAPRLPALDRRAPRHGGGRQAEGREPRVFADQRAGG